MLEQLTSRLCLTRGGCGKTDCRGRRRREQNGAWEVAPAAGASGASRWSRMGGGEPWVCGHQMGLRHFGPGLGPARFSYVFVGVVEAPLATGLRA